MFEKMRLKKQQLSEEEAIKILESGEFGVLSTAGLNGYPYGVPLNYIYADGKIYIHSAVTGSKLKCFENDSRVSFCVVGKADLVQEDVNTLFESVILFGKISEITDQEARMDVFEKFIRILCPDFVSGGMEYIKENQAGARVYAIDIEYMTGKRGE